MAQHDYTIANQGFPATRSDLNNVLQAIATNNSGTSAPSTQYAGQFWLDTNTPSSTTWSLYIHDGSDDILFAQIDTSANTVNFLDSALADNVVINTSGAITTTGAFTSKGIDDNADALAMTIGSTEQIGIGSTGFDQDAKLTIASSGSGGANPSSISANTIATFRRTGGTSHVANISVLGGSSGASILNLGDRDDEDVGNIIYEHSSNYMAFTTGASERMRINSTGLGIGTSSPSSYYANHLVVDIGSTAQSGITIVADSSNQAMLAFADGTSGDTRYRGYLDYNHSNDSLAFASAGTERMRIDSSGSVLIKKTTSGFNTAGFEVKSGDEPIYVTTENNSNILVNRRSSDGSLIRFYRSTSEKGSISVSGETVSYNGFTGSHWSRFTDNSKPTILRGTVLETLDEMLDWYNLEYNITTTTKDEDGNDVTNTETLGVPHVLTDSQSVGDTITYNHEGTDVQATIVKEADVKHMMSKVSDTTDAKYVYGVSNCYDEQQSEEGYNDFLVASVGSFLVRIKGNEIIAKGDLLQSNGDGTAKVQSDDNIKSSSFAKVLSTTIIETYEDGSYLVPCSLNC